MAADGLTKALSAANHDAFVGMTGIENQEGLLASIRKEDEPKDALHAQRPGAKHSVAFGYSVGAS